MPQELLLKAEWLLWIAIGVWGFYYFFFPYIVYRGSRIMSRPHVELIDWDNYPLPAAYRERIERDGQQLEDLGFERGFAYTVNVMKGNSEVVSFTHFHPELNVATAITGTLLGMKNGYLLLEMSTILATAYPLAGRPRLQTTNQDQVLNLGLRSQDIVHNLPHVKAVARLLDIHNHAEQRHFAGTPRESQEKTEDRCEFIRTMYQEILDSWISTDKIERVPNEPDYRFKVQSLYQACWAKWLPLGPLFKLIRYHWSRQLERDLRATSV